jgi:DNA invertase Pin-like site-specific DNA recombinase
LPSGIARSRKVGGLRWGGRVGAAKINAESDRQRAKEAAVRRIIAQCLKGGYDWSEVMRRRETRASIPFDAKHSKRVRSNLDQLG